MLFSIANRALFRGILAGAVILAGTSACSRSDRTESGSDTTAAVLPDTMTDQAASNQTGTSPAAMPSTDTAATSSGDTVGTTARTPAPRAETADEEAAGYRGMERDTSSAEISDTSTEMADAAVDTTADAAADTAAAGYAGMARDTSTTPEQLDTIAQADTVAQAEGDVALQARVDTAHAEADVSVEADVAPAGEADTATIHAQVDTTADVPTEVAVESSPDTVTVVGDSSSVDKPGPRAKEDTIATKADSLAQYHEAERIRPPEDSTEILGNVTGDENADEADISREDRPTVAAEARAEAPTDEVGAAAIAGNVTGVEAVALMTRQGEKCIVVDPESNEAVRWDMSSTPSTLNPCGIGSMNLSKVWTSKE
jgi:hypothetical protein